MLRCCCNLVFLFRWGDVLRLQVKLKRRLEEQASSFHCVFRQWHRSETQVLFPSRRRKRKRLFQQNNSRSNVWNNMLSWRPDWPLQIFFGADSLLNLVSVDCMMVMMRKGQHAFASVFVPLLLAGNMWLCQTATPPIGLKPVVTQAREKERGVSLRRNAGAGNYTLED